MTENLPLTENRRELSTWEQVLPHQTLVSMPTFVVGGMTHSIEGLGNRGEMERVLNDFENTKSEWNALLATASAGANRKERKEHALILRHFLMQARESEFPETLLIEMLRVLGNGNKAAYARIEEEIEKRTHTPELISALIATLAQSEQTVRNTNDSIEGGAALPSVQIGTESGFAKLIEMMLANPENYPDFLGCAESISPDFMGRVEKKVEIQREKERGHDPKKSETERIRALVSIITKNREKTEYADFTALQQLAKQMQNRVERFEKSTKKTESPFSSISSGLLHFFSIQTEMEAATAILCGSPRKNQAEQTASAQSQAIEFELIEKREEELHSEKEDKQGSWGAEKQIAEIEKELTQLQTRKEQISQHRFSNDPKEFFTTCQTLLRLSERFLALQTASDRLLAAEKKVTETAKQLAVGWRDEIPESDEQKIAALLFELEETASESPILQNHSEWLKKIQIATDSTNKLTEAIEAQELRLRTRLNAKSPQRFSMPEIGKKTRWAVAGIVGIAAVAAALYSVQPQKSDPPSAKAPPHTPTKTQTKSISPKQSPEPPVKPQKKHPKFEIGTEITFPAGLCATPPTQTGAMVTREVIGIAKNGDPIIIRLDGTKCSVPIN